MFERLRAMIAGGGMAPPTQTPRAARTRTGATQARNHYEAGAHTRRTIGWGTADPTPAGAAASVPTIRARTRDAIRNDAWASAIVETLVDDAIGWGVTVRSAAPDDAVQAAVQDLWDRWSIEADATGTLDLAGLQALAFRGLIVDGEVFIRLRRRQPTDGLTVPLQLEVLPPEYCPAEQTLPATEGRTVREGIEFDAIGRRTAYLLRECLPGEDDGQRSSARLHRVPAAQVLHLYNPLRPGQRRGVPALAAALVRLRELDKYSDAMLLRQQLANLFVAFVTRQPQLDDEALDPITGLPVDAASAKEPLGMEPGIFQELDPGEDVRFSDPPDPPAGYGEFTTHQLRGACAAVGVPYGVVSGDWGSTNDRLARVVLSQYRRKVQRLVWSLFIPQVLRPLTVAWVDVAYPSLLRRATAALDRDAAARFTFAPQSWPYLHPVQDVQATERAIRAGLTSRAAAVSEQGEDVEQIDAAQAADNARADRLGLQYDSDARDGGAQ